MLAVEIFKFILNVASYTSGDFKAFALIISFSLNLVTMSLAGIDP